MQQPKPADRPPRDPLRPIVSRAVALGGVFLWYAARMKVSDDPSLPMRTFSWSITYLMALFTALLVDHYLF